RDRNVTGVQTCALPIWSLAFRWRKESKKIKHRAARVVCSVDYADWEIERIARFHDALLSCHPLFGCARKDIENLLHLRMEMKRVRFARRQLGAHEHQIGVA